jgi:DNA-binding winged helix-turn-helix (wHTH) protein
VLAGGEVLTLSVREFQLLVAMVDRAGGIVRRDELCQAVWGRELRPGDRSVDVYVSKLRAKLEAAAPGRQFIHTHPGFGYRFQPQLSREIDTHPHEARDWRRGVSAAGRGRRGNGVASPPSSTQAKRGNVSDVAHTPRPAALPGRAARARANTLEGLDLVLEQLDRTLEASHTRTSSWHRW